MTYQKRERLCQFPQPLIALELPLVGIGFVLSVLWEFLQSPFYTDTFTASWDVIAFNRLHCAGGDALIMLTAFWIVAIPWGRDWMHSEKWVPAVVFIALGIVYTAYSEHFNVHITQRWAYSNWMPTIAGIGIVPLVQWIVVPILLIRNSCSR